MSKSLDPTNVVSLLKNGGMAIDQCNIGKPVTADDRAFIKVIGYDPPPPEIDPLYDQYDGFTVIWHGTLLEKETGGSINIHPYSASVSRAPKEETGAPLEGILWTDDTSDKLRATLQKMTIFETVVGRSQFLTYIVGADKTELFLVERDEIKPIIPNFTETISALFAFAGVNGLRDMLVEKDWKKRIAEDPICRVIASWR